jgi:hypothetical protein
MEARSFKEKKYFAHENMKNPPSKDAHNRPKNISSIAIRPKTRPNLNFCPVKIAHCVTYV